MGLPLLKFTKSEPLTLGVEVELQIVDRETNALAPAAGKLIAASPAGRSVKAEIFQSMIEVNSGVCRTAADAERDLRATTKPLLALARARGLRFIATGTHPFERFSDRLPFPAKRYHDLLARNQWIARRLLVFGLHVHVGMPDGETCIAVQNELLHDLAMLLAVSTSSPFWQGNATGLASSRITVFEAMPTAAMPALVGDWAEFCSVVDALKRSRAIKSLKDLWWDIRPSPKFGTLEIRVCDGLATIRETCVVVALAHGLARRAAARVSAGSGRLYPPGWRIRENKWRASRHGMNADLVVADDGTSVPVREWLGQTLDDLEGGGFLVGSEPYVGALRALAAGALTSADRQLALFAETKDLNAVARSLAEEFETDIDRG